jgi:adenylate cyclase class 2
MPVELEAKMPVSDFAPVRDALRRLGATGGDLTFETNRFFDTPDHALRTAGRGLRLRTNCDASKGRETHVITHKGPLIPGAFKSREETELTVANADDASLLLSALGFRRTIVFEKYRESWKLGRCKIELDEVPHLGRFVEIEGPDEAAIMEMRGKLGLADVTATTRSYVGMLADHLAGQGKEMEEVRFPTGR